MSQDYPATTRHGAAAAHYAGPEPQDWVFTFGSAHRAIAARSRFTPDADLGIGFPLRNRYVVIRGTFDSARQRMSAIFGTVWSSQYGSREAAGVDEYGLTELVVEGAQTRSTPDVAAEHPESTCGRCGGPNRVWCAPSPLWNEIMRGGDINGGPEPHHGIVCPTCFMILAEEAGIASRWRLNAEQVHRPLQTITPSGRIWNEQTWLWEAAPCQRCGGTRAVPQLTLGGKHGGEIVEVACPACSVAAEVTELVITDV